MVSGSTCGLAGRFFFLTMRFTRLPSALVKYVTVASSLLVGFVSACDVDCGFGDFRSAVLDDSSGGASRFGVDRAGVSLALAILI